MWLGLLFGENRGLRMLLRGGRTLHRRVLCVRLLSLLQYLTFRSPKSETYHRSRREWGGQAVSVAFQRKSRVRRGLVVAELQALLAAGISYRERAK
jgi:hypothetical protein